MSKADDLDPDFKRLLAENDELGAENDRLAEENHELLDEVADLEDKLSVAEERLDEALLDVYDYDVLVEAIRLLAEGKRQEGIDKAFHYLPMGVRYAL